MRKLQAASTLRGQLVAFQSVLGAGEQFAGTQSAISALLGALSDEFDFGRVRRRRVGRTAAQWQRSARRLQRKLAQKEDELEK
eukprot:938687-Pyramimonas_sp.AAC.1